MMPFTNQLILASAGTGKTYRLTNQFLRLLLSGVGPERVLATTFTRKAAGEILDRVLERLVEAAESTDGLMALRQALDWAGLERQDCLDLLVKLTRSLDSFQVRTLDSFFAHLVRLFGLDLELPPNWSISDDREDQDLQGEAMRDMLEHAERDEILELLRDLQKGDADRGVQQPLLRRASELRMVGLESREGAWSALDAGTPVAPRDFELARQGLVAAPLAQTKAGTDRVHWVRSRREILAAIEAEEWREILRKGLGEKCLQDPPIFSGAEIEGELLAALRPIVAQARYQVLAELVARNRAVEVLLERFEHSYQAVKRATGRYRFDDLPLALAPRTATAQLFDEREAELWFRLDGRIDHLLLDEFQDTSPIQWRILEPLASEITSTGGGERSFFCVGDPKQSIYGFRYAEPRLLENLEQMLPGLVAERMDQSYRSSQIVLDAVNMVFAGIEANPAFAGEARQAFRAGAESWSRRFAPHQAARDLPGVVHVVEAAEPGPDEAKAQPLLRCAVERVQSILREAPGAEVGMLTRLNKNIPLLIHALREQGIDASGEGGNALTDSEAVLVYISMLQLADHPGDTAAAFHVASSRLAGWMGLQLQDDAERRSHCARWLRAELVNRGLGVVTAELARLVDADPDWSDWDKARFAQLVDSAYAFEARRTLRASEFVGHLRVNGVVAPGGARVRVMTVHASKGLEFDAVVLPELDSRLVGQRDSHLTARPDPAGLIEVASLSPGQALLPLSPLLEELYEAATVKSVEDSLCALYVAMTRAKRRLEIILPWGDVAKTTKPGVPTYAKLVRAALPDDELLSDQSDGVIWRAAGNAAADAWAAGLRSDDEPGAEPAAPPSLALAESTTPRFQRRCTASTQDAGGSTVTAATLLRISTGARVGSLVHAAFEACEWIEDFEFDPGTLDTGGVAAEVAATARTIIEHGLAAEEIRRALSRAACAAPAGAELRVTREHAFSVFLDDPAGFWNGAIDRLVVARQDGEAVWAEVIDFKSDHVAKDEIEQRAEHYRPQLEVYAQVVAAQTGLAIASIKLRLAFVSAGRVIDLTP